MITTLKTTYPDYLWVHVDSDGTTWPTYDCYIGWCHSHTPGRARVGKEDFMSVWLSNSARRTDTYVHGDSALATAHAMAAGHPVAGAATTIAPGAAAPGPAPAPAAPHPTAAPTLAAVLAERKTQHGDFTDHATYSQSFKEVIKQAADDRTVRGQEPLSMVQQEGLEMIMHKAARILAGDPNHDDHWRDIAGYATVTADRIQR